MTVAQSANAHQPASHINNGTLFMYGNWNAQLSNTGILAVETSDATVSLVLNEGNVAFNPITSPRSIQASRLMAKGVSRMVRCG